MSKKATPDDGPPPPTVIPNLNSARQRRVEMTAVDPRFDHIPLPMEPSTVIPNLNYAPGTRRRGVVDPRIDHIPPLMEDSGYMTSKGKAVDKFKKAEEELKIMDEAQCFIQDYGFLRRAVDAYLKNDHAHDPQTIYVAWNQRKMHKKIKYHSEQGSQGRHVAQYFSPGVCHSLSAN